MNNRKGLRSRSKELQFTENCRSSNRGDKNFDPAVMFGKLCSVFDSTRSPIENVMPWSLSTDYGKLSKILALRSFSALNISQTQF